MKAYFDLICLFVLQPKHYHNLKIVPLKAFDG